MGKCWNAFVWTALNSPISVLRPFLKAMLFIYISCSISLLFHLEFPFSLSCSISFYRIFTTRCNSVYVAG